MLKIDNHTRIPNEFIDLHMKNLSPKAVLIFIAICRKTSGWQKAKDYISNKQICDMTGLSKNSVIEGVKELESKDLIVCYRQKTDTGYNHINVYDIGYFTGERVPNGGGGGAGDAPGGGAGFAPTKETFTKEKKRDVCIYPTRQEVEVFFKEKSLVIDPNAFFDFFTADEERLWVDSKNNKVKNWKQKAITWNSYKKPSSPTNAVLSNNSKPISDEQIDKEIREAMAVTKTYSEER